MDKPYQSLAQRTARLGARATHYNSAVIQLTLAETGHCILTSLTPQDRVAVH